MKQLRISVGWLVALAVAAPAATHYPAVRPGMTLSFPAGHGAHPQFRTEWWYVTGWLRTASGQDLGFQITFFRTRPHVDERNPSRFTAHQVLFAHAALSDLAAGRLLHGERAARAGFSLAGARTDDADIAIRDWRLNRSPNGRWAAHVDTPGFALGLNFQPTQAPLLEGQNGYSRKGPDARQASYYYSIPHLRVSGRVRRGSKVEVVSGEAWLDREWSSDYLARSAQGWDWTGLNFDDGSALMAFRIRGKGGGTIWAGGSYRQPGRPVTVFGPADVSFRPLASWRSASTGALYPVEQELGIRMQGRIERWRLKPMFAAQELDSRQSGLPVYWEGAVSTPGGRGYLELTGYDRPLKM